MKGIHATFRCLSKDLKQANQQRQWLDAVVYEDQDKEGGSLINSSSYPHATFPSIHFPLPNSI